LTGGHAAAVDAFLRECNGWAGLPFFCDGEASRLARLLDEHIAQGRRVIPPAADVFTALRLTPPEMVRVVILGQDPYPTPGDAHGLSFSVRAGVPLPRSLRNIFRELAEDVPGWSAPAAGDLTAWARRGVLLLNACLTVEAGQAGAHRRLGWERLSDEAIAAISHGSAGAVFVLWGADAQRKRELVDEARHLVIATAHPSPLSARRGFFGSRPFSRANAWLSARGLPKVDWRL
jgi:uracil-DNA glycosylase